MIRVENLGDTALEALRNIQQKGQPTFEEAISSLQENQHQEDLSRLLCISDSRYETPEAGVSLVGFTVNEVLSQTGAGLCLRVSHPDESGELVLKELIDHDIATRVRTLIAQLHVTSAANSATALPRGFVADGKHVFLVRPFVEGVTLARIIDILSKEEVPPDSPTWRLAAGARGGGANVTGAKMVCRIGQYASQALVDAHARGVIHGALKPENLICDDTLKPTVLDFGCGVPWPVAVAPEMLEAGTGGSESSDLYALGAVLHRSITRCELFGDEDTGGGKGLERAIRTMKPIRPLKVNFKASKEMNTIILSLLEKTPADRYHTAAELKDDLDRYHRNDPIQRKSKGLLKRFFG